MDYGKVSDLLGYIWLEGVELAAHEYLPSDYWKEYQDELQLAAFISAGWAELTQTGKDMIDVAWDTLCEIRELDPAVMYDNLKDFFEAQAVEAEVVPIEKGKKNG
jgi:hypothetical protein